MIRHPPKSTLFPYPTLFRSHSEATIVGVHAPRQSRGGCWDDRGIDHGEGVGERLRTVRQVNGVRCARGEQRRGRSEEHTSELQSPCNLVCRLLLEKKNVYGVMLAQLAVTKLLLVICNGGTYRFLKPEMAGLLTPITLAPLVLGVFWDRMHVATACV